MTSQGPDAVAGTAWSNPGLGQAGTVLLLVGWILGIVMAGLALLMGLFFLVWRAVAGRMRDGMMGPWWDDASDWPHWTMGDPWGWFDWFGWFTGAFVVFSLLAIIVGTVLVFLGWQAVGRGDHQKAGILGIVGGAVMILFSSLSGIVAILGGVFVLAATAHNDKGPSPTPEEPPSRGDHGEGRPPSPPR